MAGNVENPYYHNMCKSPRARRQLAELWLLSLGFTVEERPAEFTTRCKWYMSRRAFCPDWRRFVDPGPRELWDLKYRAFETVKARLARRFQAARRQRILLEEAIDKQKAD